MSLLLSAAIIPYRRVSLENLKPAQQDDNIPNLSFSLSPITMPRVMSPTTAMGTLMATPRPIAKTHQNVLVVPTALLNYATGTAETLSSVEKSIFNSLLCANAVQVAFPRKRAANL